MQQVVVCGRNFRVMRTTTPSATMTAPAAATGVHDDQAVTMPSAITRTFRPASSVTLWTLTARCARPWGRRL